MTEKNNKANVTRTHIETTARRLDDRSLIFFYTQVAEANHELELADITTLGVEEVRRKINRLIRTN